MRFPSRVVVLWSGVANSVCRFDLLVLYVGPSLEEELVQ
ncbi:hypothetical protein A2U01_0075739, partial [Trifolium medium]|nr:hypothetical protein [Trifolium medium]